jgi:hypothetical protein
MGRSGDEPGITVGKPEVWIVRFFLHHLTGLRPIAQQLCCQCGDWLWLFSLSHFLKLETLVVPRPGQVVVQFEFFRLFNPFTNRHLEGRKRAPAFSSAGE